MKLPWEEIKELTEYIKDNGLAEISIDTKEGKLTIKKEGQVVSAPIQAAPPSAPAPSSSKSSESKSQASPSDGNVITAPMVGTYYEAASPGSDPFIKVGSKVNKGDVICIIEAMKIMNELPSEVSGTVKEILVNNGDIVEYGQPLVRVE